MVKPLITIIIPCWNVENWITKCLESIFSQGYSNFEVITIIDNSPDNTLTKILDYKDKFDSDNKIKIITNIENIGSSKSRQLGIDAAKGEYVYFLDADDWIETNTFSLLISELDKYPNTDIISGNFQDVYKDSIIPYKNNPTELNRITPKNIAYGMMARRIRWNLWNRLIKRELLHSIKMPNNNNGEDYVLMCNLYYIAQKIRFISDVTNNYNHINENTFQRNTNLIKNVNLLTFLYSE